MIIFDGYAYNIDYDSLSYNEQDETYNDGEVKLKATRLYLAISSLEIQKSSGLIKQNYGINNGSNLDTVKLNSLYIVRARGLLDYGKFTVFVGSHEDCNKFIDAVIAVADMPRKTIKVKELTLW